MIDILRVVVPGGFVLKEVADSIKVGDLYLSVDGDENIVVRRCEKNATGKYAVVDVAPQKRVVFEYDGYRIGGIGDWYLSDGGFAPVADETDAPIHTYKEVTD